MEAAAAMAAAAMEAVMTGTEELLLLPMVEVAMEVEVAMVEAEAGTDTAVGTVVHPAIRFPQTCLWACSSTECRVRRLRADGLVSLFATQGFPLQIEVAASLMIVVIVKCINFGVVDFQEVIVIRNAQELSGVHTRDTSDNERVNHRDVSGLVSHSDRHAKRTRKVLCLLAQTRLQHALPWSKNSVTPHRTGLCQPR